jgi:EAL domain-containing protein (putative c-di-GMP-specific phosphodiesterase class I)/GGDEF domain-containing protein
MNEQNAVPLLVVSAEPESAEKINSILRRAGHAVHCTWVTGSREAADALEEIQPLLLLTHVDAGQDELQALLDLRDRVGSSLALIVVSESALDEAQIVELLGIGVHDAVSFAHPNRLTAVVLREVRAYRTRRAHEVAEQTASHARLQLDNLLAGSHDAIAQVQEGILVEANGAWLDLLGVDEAVIGDPVMDLFDESARGALRAALSAAVQGKWSDQPLSVTAPKADGPFEIMLMPGEHDGEPCVRLVVPTGEAPARVASAVRTGETPEPGLIGRRELLAALLKRAATPARGVRCLALIRIDQQGVLEREVGVTGGEEVMAELGALLKDALQPGELAGHFGERQLLAQLERGSQQEIDAWSQQLIARLRKHAIRGRGRMITVEAAIGLAPMAAGASLDAVIAAARERARGAPAAARPAGGAPSTPAPRPAARTSPPAAAPARAPNNVRPLAAPATTAGLDDRTWAQQLRSALIDNRFQLVQQPISSLQGEDVSMFDVQLRMLDPTGREVLPAELMAAAGRTGLARNIDRWVVGASLSFAAQRLPGCLFVSLSRDTACDASFVGWLDNRLRAGAQSDRLCLQISEEIAVAHTEQVRELSESVRERGFRFALESFGTRADSLELLDHVPADFLKLDASLIQDIVSDPEQLQHVRMLVDAASQRFIQTIGENVEDPDAMSVLWQAGMQYVQVSFTEQPRERVRR